MCFVINTEFKSSVPVRYDECIDSIELNDLTIGWQNLNPLSHPNTTLFENLNYATLASQGR